MELNIKATGRREPWNKGKIVGQTPAATQIPPPCIASAKMLPDGLVASGEMLPATAPATMVPPLIGRDYGNQDDADSTG